MKEHTGIAQIGFVPRCFVANILGGVVDILVRFAKTGGSDALVRDSLSRHVGVVVVCNWVW